jgi:hypothetical protein
MSLLYLRTNINFFSNDLIDESHVLGIDVNFFFINDIIDESSIFRNENLNFLNGLINEFFYF